MGSIQLVMTGIAAGILSGMFGIGGGIILVPILVLLFDMPQHKASGTSLVALLLPVGALGVWQYFRAGKIDTSDLRSGLLIAAGITVGTLGGAYIATPLSEIVLRRSFAALLMALAVYLWLRK